MADGASELREALERLIDTKAGSLAASWGVQPGSRVVAPTNPFAGTPDLMHEQVFSTGYSGGFTVLPAIWNLSVWGEGDVFVD
jgi:hypothetical protein